MAFPTVTMIEAFTTGATQLPNWEVVPRVRSFDQSQGRSSELDQESAGTCRVVVDGRDRSMDPANTAGSHYPNVTPNRRVKIGAGYVGEVFQDLPNGYWRLGEPNSLYAFIRDDMEHADGVASSVFYAAAGALYGNDACNFVAASPSYVTIADSAGWLRFTVELSVEAWVSKSGSGGNGTVFAKTSPSGEAYALFFTGNTPHFKITDTGGTAHDCFGGSVTPDAYAHVVGTYDHNTMRLYVDDVLVASLVVGAVTIRNGVGNAYIGSYLGFGGFYMDGYLDEIAVYGYAIPADRIHAHYATKHVDHWGEHIFSGFADAHNVSYRNPSDTVVEIPCTDMFKLLARTEVPLSRPEESSGDRVRWILAAVTPGALHYVVYDGTAILAADDPAADPWNNALSALHGIDATENGRMFVDRNGWFMFLSREALRDELRITTPLVTFSDDPAAWATGAIPYTDIVFENSDTLIRNIVDIDRPDADTITVEDATSVVAHGQLRYSRKVLDATAAAANATGEVLLATYKSPITRVLGVTVKASRATPFFPYGLYGPVMSLRIGDRVTVERTDPPGGGPAISQDCFVIQRKHSASADQRVWTAQFAFAAVPELPVGGEWDSAVWNTGKWGY